MRSPGGSHTQGTPPWLRQWLGDGTLMLVAQAMTVVATSVAAIAVARSLQPTDWAIFSAFLGLSMALALVIDFGLGTWLLRELAALFADGVGDDARREAGRILSGAVVINAAVALPAVLAGAVWVLVATPEPDVSIALIGLLGYGALTAGCTALEACLRARRQIALVVAASFVEKGTLVALLVGASLLELGLAALGLAYLAAGACRLTLDAMLVFVRGGVPFAQPRRSALVVTARGSMPFALTAASLNFVPRLDTLALVLPSAAAAAWFAIGDRALGPALLIPATLGATLFPFMAVRSARHTPPWRIAAATGALGGALCVAAVVLAPWLVPLVFGDEYADAVPVVQVMALTLPLIYATSPLLVVAYSHGRERSLLLPALAASIAGTLMIVGGQIVAGPVLAAAGVVVRSAAFLSIVGYIAIAAWRADLTSGIGQEIIGTTPVTTVSS